MSDFTQMVLQFHDKYGHYISYIPQIPHHDVVDLRYRLIEEEMSETLGALRDIMNSNPRADDEVGWTPTDDLVALADGIADSIVVLIGTAISFGIPINKVFAEVHRSNMTKSALKNEYGKTIKGADFELPKIREIIQDSMK